MTQAAEQLWRDLMRSDDPTIIFVHIPRTAGMTLTHILQRIYPRQRSYSFPSADVEGAIFAFRMLPVEERRRFRLVSGHIMFGIHDAVPRPFTYITMLRDPLDRLISLYFYIIETPTHRLHEGLCSTGMRFEDFVRSGITLETDNWQTRAISGVRQDFGCCSEAMLRQAKQNLVEWFSVYGVTERFDETLVLLRRALAWQWRSLYHTPENATRGRPKRNDVARPWIEAVERQNPLDLELYAFARRRLDRLFDEDPELKRESEHLRQRNARYQPILSDRLEARTLKNRVLAQFGTAALMVGGSAGLLSTVSNLKRNPAIRSSVSAGAGRLDEHIAQTHRDHTASASCSHAGHLPVGCLTTQKGRGERPRRDLLGSCALLRGESKKAWAAVFSAIRAFAPDAFLDRTTQNRS